MNQNTYYTFDHLKLLLKVSNKKLKEMITKGQIIEWHLGDVKRYKINHPSVSLDITIAQETMRLEYLNGTVNYLVKKATIGNDEVITYEKTGV